MRLVSILAAAAALAATTMAVPAMADHGRGHDDDRGRNYYYDRGGHHGQGYNRNDRHHRDSDRRNYRGEDRDHRRGDRDRHHDNREYGWSHGKQCPPGQYKKDGECRRNKDKRTEHRSGQNVGDLLRVRDYTYINNPQRFSLPENGNWRYYRRDGRIYRVDSQTQRIQRIYNERR
ncbi:hypothetical protein [Paracoccus cavernae]|uniref:hypothetical protein n=1 Tax=Paracoccus cavernae TaxID=1571207 RepID=UPI0035F49EC0